MAKKKKQNDGGDCSNNNGAVDLKSVIHDHSLFFDKLVDLIPPKFYLPVDEDDKPYFQGLSKAKKAAARKESRLNIKKARRDRLDPDKSSITTLDLLKRKSEDDKKKLDEDVESDDDEDDDDDDLGLEDRSVTYEELRQRYRRKLEELRGNRNNGESERAKRKRSDFSDKNGVQLKRRKRDDDSREKKTADVGAKVNEKDVEEAAKELAFSHVKLDNDQELGKKKKKKLSKMAELKIAQELAETKKNPEKSDIASKHSWKAATSRAAGIKIHDNPKLLKESIKKEKKRQQKNAEKWKERAQTTEKMKADKQKARAGNISDRIHQNKMRKIEKREKKLMRPGFEGRKEGFA